MIARLLLLDDGKPGHFNQSLAFARLLGCSFETVRVGFPGRLQKTLSYLFGAMAHYTPGLFRLGKEPEGPFDAVVSAGTNTYYANLTLSRRFRCRSIAVMLPRGYRYADFDRILAQEHDLPPQRDNIIPLPVNLCDPRPAGVFSPEQGVRYAGLIVGGPNRVFDMPVSNLQEQINSIARLLPGHALVVATSRRTPPDVEALLAGEIFREAWIYSQDPVNPIPDFLVHCDYLFVTADSTSMISEAVCCGSAAVEVLPLPAKGRPGKFADLIEGLARDGCLHLYQGELADCRRKIDLAALLAGVS